MFSCQIEKHLAQLSYLHTKTILAKSVFWELHVPQDNKHHFS